MVGKFKKLDHKNTNAESMFVLTVLQKIKQTRLKFSQGSVRVLSKATNYKETRVNLINIQLNEPLQQKIRQEQC